MVCKLAGLVKWYSSMAVLMDAHVIKLDDELARGWIVAHDISRLKRQPLSSVFATGRTAFGDGLFTKVQCESATVPSRALL